MKQTFADLLRERSDDQMKATVLEAILSIAEESFIKKDGQKPKNLLVTSEGRKIPSELIEQVLVELRTTLLEPLQEKIKTLDEREV